MIHAMARAHPTTAQALLDEGSLEARTYAKRVLWSIRRLAGSEDAFDRLCRRLPDAKARQVRGVFEGQAGPPPAPKRPGSRVMGSGAVPAARLLLLQPSSQRLALAEHMGPRC